MSDLYKVVLWGGRQMLCCRECGQCFGALHWGGGGNKPKCSLWGSEAVPDSAFDRLEKRESSK